MSEQTRHTHQLTVAADGKEHPVTVTWLTTEVATSALDDTNFLQQPSFFRHPEFTVAIVGGDRAQARNTMEKLSRGASATLGKLEVGPDAEVAFVPPEPVYFPHYTVDCVEIDVGDLAEASAMELAVYKALVLTETQWPLVFSGHQQFSLTEVYEGFKSRRRVSDSHTLMQWAMRDAHEFTADLLEHPVSSLKCEDLFK